MNYQKIKRLMDVVISFFALIVLSPLLITVALISAMKQGYRNVLFLQARVGLHRAKFEVVKFKTMNDRRDPEGKLLSDEERTTAWGRFLRRYSIDELPQLFNVLAGDMSIVGPRPLIEQQVRGASGSQLIRFEVKPGITGLAQINGRNDLSFEQRFRYDAWYVERVSLPLDIYIIARTAGMVFTGAGQAYNPAVGPALQPAEQELDIAVRSAMVSLPQEQAEDTSVPVTGYSYSSQPPYRGGDTRISA